jgi:hypothetical protein
MALTTVDAFNQFYERIRPSSALLETVKQRKAAVTSALERAFPSSSDMRFKSATTIGSLGRGTASKPVDDLDLLVHIHVDNDLWERSYRHDSKNFLYRVREAVDATSTVQKIGARGQAVRLFYADGLNVDIAAVEKCTDGSYALPNGSGGWQTTNPIAHADYLNRRNAELSGDLKRFIQIAKQWNRAHSSRLSSFHLEMLAANTFSSLNNDRRNALEVFFNGIYYGLSVQDPAGHSGDLSSYLTPLQRDAVNASLLSAHKRAQEANAAEARGDHEEAIRLWKIILGSDFPNYG